MNPYPDKSKYSAKQIFVATQETEIPLSYRPVTAYTVTKPVMVAGVNINNGLYPVLIYQPPHAKYPNMYVPIAAFDKVGGKVFWDEKNSLMTVTTDYYINKQRVLEQQKKIDELQTQADLLEGKDNETILDLKAKINELQSQIDALKVLTKLVVTGVSGVTEPLLAEINNLIETKTLSEIIKMYQEIFEKQSVIEQSKGGKIVVSTGYNKNSYVVDVIDRKNGIDKTLFNFQIHTNDSNLATNSNWYAKDQLENFYKFYYAILYVLFMLKDFKLDVTGIDGVTDAQRTEIYNLVETKTLSELREMYNQAYKEADSAAVAKGGSLDFGVGYGDDGFGMDINVKTNTDTDNFSFYVHSNDPGLYYNLNMYSDEQKERFNKFINATPYIIYRDIIEKMNAFP